MTEPNLHLYTRYTIHFTCKCVLFHPRFANMHALLTMKSYCCFTRKKRKENQDCCSAVTAVPCCHKIYATHLSFWLHPAEIR